MFGEKNGGEIKARVEINGECGDFFGRNWGKINLKLTNQIDFKDVMNFKLN